MVWCLRWWRVRWQSFSMCLVCSWKIELWTIWIKLWLSQYIGVRWESKTPIFASNQRNQPISLVIDVITWYFVSVKDWKIIDYFLLFQEIRESLIKNTKTSNKLMIYEITSMISIIIYTQLQGKGEWK